MKTVHTSVIRKYKQIIKPGKNNYKQQVSVHNNIKFCQK